MFSYPSLQEILLLHFFEFWTNFGIFLILSAILFGGRWVKPLAMLIGLFATWQIGVDAQKVYTKYKVWENLQEQAVSLENPLQTPQVLGLEINWIGRGLYSRPSEQWNLNYFAPSLYEILWTEQTRKIQVVGYSRLLRADPQRQSTPIYELSYEPNQSICDNWEYRSNLFQLMDEGRMYSQSDADLTKKLETPVLLTSKYGSPPTGCIVAETIDAWAADVHISMRYHGISNQNYRPSYINIIFRLAAESTDGEVLSERVSTRFSHGDFFDLFAPEYYEFGNTLVTDFLEETFKYKLEISSEIAKNECSDKVLPRINGVSEQGCFTQHP